MSYQYYLEHQKYVLTVSQNTKEKLIQKQLQDYQPFIND